MVRLRVPVWFKINNWLGCGCRIGSQICVGAFAVASAVRKLGFDEVAGADGVEN